MTKDSSSMLLKPEEAMTELRVSRATLFKLLRPGQSGEPAQIESFLIGPNARRIPRTAIEAYVARKLADVEAAQASQGVA